MMLKKLGVASGLITISVLLSPHIAQSTTQSNPPWYLDRIDANPGDQAYEYTATGNGVVVYMLDTGIRSTHAEFLNAAGTASRVLASYDVPSSNDPSTDNNDCIVSNIPDPAGHGTATAGLVGGRTLGVAKDVNFVAVHVTKCTSIVLNNSQNISRALQIIEDDLAMRGHPKAVVNMSLFAGYSGKNNTLKFVIEPIRDFMARTGVPVVAAADTGSINACDEAIPSMDEVIAVGGTDRDDESIFDSNYDEAGRSCIDVWAPGQYISFPSLANDTDIINDTNGLYAGTSFASALVTGVVAAYLENHSGADITPSAIQSMIKDTATPDEITVTQGPAAPYLTDLVFMGW